MPWQGRRCFTWNATIVDRLAYDHISLTVPGGAANAAATHKHVKYDIISATYIFVPVAVEILGPYSDEGLKFVSEYDFVFQQSRMMLENLICCSGEFQFEFNALTKLLFVEPFKTYQKPKVNHSSPVFNFVFNPRDPKYREY